MAEWLHDHGLPGKLVALCRPGSDAEERVVGEAVAEYLRDCGMDVLVTRQPADWPRAASSPVELIQAALGSRVHQERVILPALREGRTVVCLGYVFSALPEARSPEIGARVRNFARGTYSPDLTLLCVSDTVYGAYGAFDVGQRVQVVETVAGTDGMIEQCIRHVAATLGTRRMACEGCESRLFCRAVLGC